MHRARWTALSSAVAVATTMAVGLVSLPLTVSYLGPERYGIWVTLNSLLAWMALLDLGMSGNALINALSEAIGRDDILATRRLVATAFWSLIALSVLCGVTVVVVAPLIDLPATFNVSSAIGRAELYGGLGVVLLAFMVGQPAQVALGVWYGTQRGYVANAVSVLSSIAALAGLLSVTSRQGDLSALALAVSGPRVAVTVMAAIYTFAVAHPEFAPSLGCLSRTAFRKLWDLGMPYGAAQLAGAGMLQSQPLILTSLAGPVEAGAFYVAQRVLTLPVLLAQLMTAPFLPAFGEAASRGDLEWIRITHRDLTRRTVWATSLAGTPLWICAPYAIDRWVAPGLSPSALMVILLAAYVLVQALAVPHSVLLYALQRVWGQARIAIITALVTVGLGVVLVLRLGTTGLAYAMLIAMVMNLIGQHRALRAAVSGHPEPSITP
jgi:O-antigen/teichoic acid export membrane protein